MHEVVNGTGVEGIQLVSEEQPPFPAPLQTSGVAVGCHEYDWSQAP